MQPTKIQKTIYQLLTQSTGTHMLDSGGDNGRHWQRNQQRSMEDFINEPDATIELYHHEDGTASATHTVSVFHHLTKLLHLDELCDEFNAIPVNNWDSDLAYGVSSEGEDWIKSTFSPDDNWEIENSWNTYNWDNALSQTLQGCLISNSVSNDHYVLLQIHQGADVRGGYTDAKLFKLNDHAYDYFLMCDVYGEHFDMREWDGIVDHEGNLLDDKQLGEIAKQLNIKAGESIIIPASANY